MMEADPEGVATCGVTSAEESRGEGLPEDHARAQALPAPLTAALRPHPPGSRAGASRARTRGSRSPAHRAAAGRAGRAGAW